MLQPSTPPRCNRRASAPALPSRPAAGPGRLGRSTSPAGRRLTETPAFFEFVEKEVEAMTERWRVHREERFGRG
ncbi:hypothetical protein [Streptomyces sp. NPDC059787]|uniref:hypothetical protein n=1 Tax=Streptomyces sp. NPDC059787 TaxID=3346947 RepID=UPI003651A143